MRSRPAANLPTENATASIAATNRAAECPCSRVELRAARIPVIGFFAHHHWFVVVWGDHRDRWEVWQFAHAGGTAWGHLHRNLLPPERGVGNGPSWIEHTWHGEDATALARTIEASPQTYPHCGRYRPWPGPNSNSYVQWILGDRFQLGRCAVGAAFARKRRWSHASKLREMPHANDPSTR